MAKKKKLEDLDAELAALEAELAALEGKSAAPAPKKAPAPTLPPAAEAPAEEAEPVSKKGRFSFGKKKAETEPEPAASDSIEATAGKRFGIPSLKKNRKAEDVDEAVDALTAAAEKAPEAPAAAAPVAPAPVAKPAKAIGPLPPGDLTHWRHEGTTWVRTIPDHEAPVVRRILDENDELVREEPATRADVDDVNGVKAERGVGKLFGGATTGAAAKLKSFRFGKRGGGDE